MSSRCCSWMTETPTDPRHRNMIFYHNPLHIDTSCRTTCRATARKLASPIVTYTAAALIATRLSCSTLTLSAIPVQRYTAMAIASTK